MTTASEGAPADSVPTTDDGSSRASQTEPTTLETSDASVANAHAAAPQDAAVQSYDFRRPGRIRDAVEHWLGTWLTGSCALLPDKWGGLMGFSVEAEPEQVTTRLPREAAPDTPIVGFRLWLDTHAEPTLLAVPRRLALALVEGLLGGLPEALPDDRELTSLELSLAEMAIQEWCAALNESQPGDDPVHVQCGEPDPSPRLVRMYAAHRPLAVVPLRIRGPFGEERIRWILPQDLVEGMCGEAPAPPSEQAHAELEQRALQLPLELVVRLGAVKLGVAELQELRPGDVILLDRRVNEPLPVFVNDEELLRGWAGRVGARQAVKVSQRTPHEPH